MDPQRWKRVEDLFHAALERDPGARGAFLDEACGGSLDLRREVETLLAHEENAASVLERPLAEVDPTITQPIGDRVGDRPARAGAKAGMEALSNWGPFRILEKVGEGGFGQVYRAWDTTLEREVALKLLMPRGLDRDAEDKALLREARSIARVRHPNVVPVYGVDRHEGRIGFWSDFVNGKTLSALLASHGPYGPQEAAHIGMDLAKAVSAVHAAGLLHRDIKTGNVMREEGGRILLMDFGLTHPVDSEHQLAGTPSYMAPELIAGEPPSVETDIYALGVLLFHLLTAKFPVEGSNFRDLKSALESGARRHLMDERPDLPEPLVRVVERAMDTDPKKRFATAGQMISALAEAVGMGPASVEAAVATPRPRRNRLKILALIAVFVFVLGPIRTWLKSGGAGSSQAGAHADYLQAQDLLDRYYQPHNVENAIPLFQKTIAEDPKFALAYAGLGRANFLRYRDTSDAKLMEAAEGAATQAEGLDAELASVRVTLGMIYTETSRYDLAAQELSEALRLDTRNAEAYGALAELYVKRGRKADVEPAFQKAIDLAPGDWRWRNQLGYFYLTAGRLPEAVDQFEQAVRLTPDNSRAYNNLGIAYGRQNHLAEARVAYEKSIQLEPTFSRFANLGTVLQAEGKNAEAAEIYRQSIGLNPSNYLAWGNLALAYGRTGSKGDSLEAYGKAISLAESVRQSRPKDATLLSQLGVYYAQIGDAGHSVPLVRQAAALAPDDPQVLYRAGGAYELLHQRQEALRAIGKALAAGLPLETVERNPDLAELRADSGFRALRPKVR